MSKNKQILEAENVRLTSLNRKLKRENKRLKAKLEIYESIEYIDRTVDQLFDKMEDAFITLKDKF